MTVGWSEPRATGGHPHAGEVVALAAKGPTAVELEAAERHTTTRQAPSSWDGSSPVSTQRGSWSLVRGKPGPAADTRSEP